MTFVCVSACLPECVFVGLKLILNAFKFCLLLTARLQLLINAACLHHLVTELLDLAETDRDGERPGEGRSSR